MHLSFAQLSVDTSIRFFLKPGVAKSARDAKINDLFLLGKIWGFLKYYHPAIASGKYNWDQALLQFLPGYCNVKTIMERNDSLSAWISRFGAVEPCVNCSDSLLKGAILKPGFSWMDKSSFSAKLIQQLKYIKSNRLQKDHYYIKFMTEDDIYLGLPQHEAAYANLVFPSDAYSILSVYRFWNFVEYWYPYKYNLPLAWDAVLKKMIVQMLQHKDVIDYTLSVEELVAHIHDSHGYFTQGKTEEVKGKYYMPFTAKFLENKLVVTSYLNDSLAAISGLQIFDIIERIDGVPVDELVTKLARYCPASNRAALLRTLSYWITRSKNPQTELTLQRNGKPVDIRVKNYIPKYLSNPNMNPPQFSFQKDTAFCIIGDQIGYINLGRFHRKDSLALKAMVAKTTRLIIDNRQNQNPEPMAGGGDIIAGIILPTDNYFAKFSTVQPSYPGVFTYSKPTDMHNNTSPDYYKGNIVILINEQTQSTGEFLTMAYQKAPKAITIGTATAGADGNVTYLSLPGSIFVQITGLGVCYPDGKETQRVGIQPAIVAKETIAGYQNNIDEQLQKAIAWLQEKR